MGKILVAMTALLVGCLAVCSVTATPPSTEAPVYCNQGFCALILGYGAPQSMTLTTRLVGENQTGATLVFKLDDGTTVAYASSSDRAAWYNPAVAAHIARNLLVNKANFWHKLSDTSAVATLCIDCDKPGAVPWSVAVAIVTTSDRLPMYLSGAQVCVWSYDFHGSMDADLVPSIHLGTRQCVTRSKTRDI